MIFKKNVIKKIYFFFSIGLLIGLFLTLLYVRAQQMRFEQQQLQSNLLQVQTLIKLADVELSQHHQLAALVAAVKAGSYFQHSALAQDQDEAITDPLYLRLREQVPDMLAKALYNTWERNNLAQHMDKVRSVAFSPSGERLVSASSDNTVKLWQKDGRLLRSIPHQSGVYGVDYSSDGSYFASVSSDYHLRLWRNNGQLLSDLKGESKARCVSISPDSQRIAVGFDDGTVWVWLRNEHLQMRWQAHEQSIEAIAFSPDGKQVATGSRDQHIKLWDADDHYLVEDFTGHQGAIYSLSFHPNKPILVSGGEDKHLFFWGLQQYTEILDPIAAHNNWIYAVRYSPDGQYIATAGSDGYTKLWNQAGMLMRQFKTANKRVLGLAFSDDSQWLATAAADRNIKLYHLDRQMSRKILQSQQEIIKDLDYNANGDLLASTGSGGKIQIWNRQYQIQSSIDNRLGIRDVDFLPNGNGENDLLMSVTIDNSIQLWRLNGVLVKTIAGAKAVKTKTIAIDPQAKFFISSHNEKLQLWNMAGQSLHFLTGHSKGVNAVSFNHSGSVFASAGADAQICIWSRDGTLLHTLKGHKNWINNISFSPDDTYLASAGSDNTIKVWLVREGRLLNTLVGHGDWVWDVDFHPDPSVKILVSASADNTLRLWDYPNAKMLRVLNAHNDWVRTVSFNSEGDEFASGGADGKIILWDFDTLKQEIDRSPPLRLQTLLEQSCHTLRDYLHINTQLIPYEPAICQ